MRTFLAIAVCALILSIALWFAKAARPSSPLEGLTVSLRVNGGIETAIERGEPLSLEVFLAGRDGSANAQLGSVSTPWSRLVSLRSDDDREFAATPTVLSPARRITLEREPEGRPAVEESDANIARLEGQQHLFMIELGLSPAVTRGLPVGRHRVRAVVDPGDSRVLRPRQNAASMLVTILVTEPSALKEARRLERASRFYITTGQYAEGREAAKALLRERPDDPGGRILLGDALKEMGETPRALEEYTKALSAFRAGRAFYEDHEGLFDRIRLVELEIAKAGNGRSLHVSSADEASETRSDMKVK